MEKIIHKHMFNFFKGHEVIKCLLSGWGGGSRPLCLSCICLLAVHKLICVTFSRPPGVGGLAAASACAFFLDFSVYHFVSGDSIVNQLL